MTPFNFNSSLAACFGLAVAAHSVPSAAAEDIALRDLLRATHVHGLAVDPADGLHLFIATHDGLFQANLMTLRAESVGGVRDDLMGFGAHPSEPGVFVASGHPSGGGNLGVVRSVDGGATWDTVSPGADGPVDFHQMEVSRADPDVIFGVQHGTTLQRSDDGGKSWSVAGQVPEKLIDIATSARSANTLFAATGTGLFISSDGGRAWTKAYDAVAPVSMVDVGLNGQVLAFVLGTGMIGADETTLAWEILGNAFGATYPLVMARDPQDEARMFAMSGDGALLSSGDGGRDWSLVTR